MNRLKEYETDERISCFDKECWSCGKLHGAMECKKFSSSIGGPSCIGGNVMFRKLIDKKHSETLSNAALESNIPLVGQTIYFLNKSCSKWICIGLHPQRNFEAVVRIVGIKKQSICFDVNAWAYFLSQCELFRKTAEESSSRFLPPPRYEKGFKISTECFDGKSRIFKMEKEGDYLYLALEGVMEVMRLSSVVDYRLEFLRDLNYSKYYNDIVDYLSRGEEEVPTAIEKALNGEMTEQACITNELSLYWIDKMQGDIDLIKKIRE